MEILPEVRMARIISVHEYKLKDGVSRQQFEAAVEDARQAGLFSLPGMIDHHFLRRIRGTRQVEFAAIWIYESRESWEKLWGKADQPVKKEHYPEKWKIWEDEILTPLLAQDPDRIDYAAYEEF
jgi:heme-degrading monooxygenase HmoA